MKCVLVCVLLLCVCADAYRILMSFAAPFRSLNILGQSFAKHLLDAGHEVTYITSFPSQNKEHHKNYHEVELSSLQGFYDNYGTDILNISYVMTNSDHSNDVGLLQEFGFQFFIQALEHENMQALLYDETQRFHAVIVDYVDTELYAGLAAVYDCPMIWSFSMGPSSMVMQLVDEPTNPAYTADLLSSNVAPFNFKQRIEELWNSVYWNWNKWLLSSKYEEAYNKIFGPIAAKHGRKLPEYADIVCNASLVLSNYHNSVGNIPKLPQNFRLVGGYHIERQTKPLPKDLQTLMDKSKNGVIYFSMGSTWKSKDIPKSVTDGLLKVFGELKQTVIWKYEEDLLNLPKNVHILKWAPQQSILAHPNMRFFISHGGLLSSMETIHFAVPQIGIPIHYDQFVNINRAVSNGYAIRVDLNFDLAKNLKVAIDTMLGDPSYKQRAKYLSSLYHDRPLAPEAELVWWIEHVIRTGGATHLISPSRMLSWYQKMYLDFAFLIIISILIILKAISALCVGKKRNFEKRKKN